jgi:hypothetical protein
MKFLIWSIVVILFLALVNAIASWLGLDVAAASEEPDAHGLAPASHAPLAVHAPASHSSDH